MVVVGRWRRDRREGLFCDISACSGLQLGMQRLDQTLLNPHFHPSPCRRFILNLSVIPTPLRYVVEGANLFITDSARDIMQDAGVILFKDASTNKGGVTCSSLEVSRGVAAAGSLFRCLLLLHNNQRCDLQIQAYQRLDEKTLSGDDLQCIRHLSLAAHSLSCVLMRRFWPL